MATATISLQALSERVLPLLASLALWSMAVLALASLVTLLLHRRAAAARFCVWQFSVGGLLVLPLVYLVLPGRPLGISLLNGASKTADAAVHERPAVRTPLLAEPGAYDAFGERGSGTTSPDVPLTVNRERRQPQRHPGTREPTRQLRAPDTLPLLGPSSAPIGRPQPLHWPTLILVVWGAGSLASLAWLLRGVVAARLLVRSAKPVCAAQPALHFPVLSSPNVQVPLAVGIARPRIVLPAEWHSWPAERLRIALAHELAHIERRDVLWHLVARTAAALYWFQPLMWLAIRQMKVLRERACDDRVLLSGVVPTAYAAGLVEIAAALRGRRLHLLGGIGMADRQQLECRIRAILNPSLLRGNASRRLRYVLFVATASLVATVGGIRPFDPVPPAIAQPARAEEARQADNAPEEPAPPNSDTGIPEDHTTTSGTMLIQVIGPDGEPIEGAHIHTGIWSEEPFPGNRDYLTDEDGLALVALPKALRILRVWGRYEGHVPLFAQWRPEEQKDGREIPELFTFRMPKGTQMGGIVTDEEGKPIEGVTVEVRRESGDLPEEQGARPRLGSWLAEGDGPDGALTTDAQGRWQLNNVPAGDDVEIRVKLSHPDYIDDERWGDLQREQNVPMQAFRDQTATIVMRRGITVAGQVTDPDGDPVEGAVVVWGHDPYFQTGSQEVLTDENGVYRFPPLPPRQETITVIAEGWMPDLQEVEIASDIAPVNFQLKPGKAIRIRFMDRSGKPISSVSVGLGRWRGGESLYNNRHPNVVYTGVPDMADENGLYEWTWAPDDFVEYEFWHKDYTKASALLTANGSEHVQVLKPVLRIHGRVTDAATGEPVEQFTVVPIEVYPDGQMRARRYNAAEHTGGEYSFTVEDNHPAYRLQVEALGYRTAVSESFQVGDINTTHDFRLEPAPPARGRVVDRDGRSVAGARVYLASKTQEARSLPGDYGGSGNFRVDSDERGEFAFPAQAEPYTIVAVHHNGYANRKLAADEQPGEIELTEWATVTGIYLREGKPVSSARISLYPVRPLSETSPIVLSSTVKETDSEGRFTFDQVFPAKWQVRPHLSGRWEGSRQAVPFELSPRESVTVNLGEGARVVGRVALTGDVPRDWSLEHSHNYLFRRANAIEPPVDVAALGYDWRNGWNDDWMFTREGRAYLDTLHGYSVKTNPDGTFVIDGVPAGEYEFALRMFAPPGEGMNLFPAARRVIRFTVTDADARRGTLDLGEVPVEASLVDLQPGDALPDFSYQTLDGTTQRMSDLRGRYVLVHFWESGRIRGTGQLPALRQLYDDYSSEERLVILGLSFDRDLDSLRRFLEEQKLPWRQGFLDAPFATDVPERLGIYNIPLNFLISPDGRLVHKSQSVEGIRTHLNNARMTRP